MGRGDEWLVPLDRWPRADRPSWHRRTSGDQTHVQLNEAELAAMLAQAINLAAACCNTGETARAKALFTEIAARGDLTDHHRAAVDDSLRKIAAHEVSAGTTKAESSAPAPDADEEARS